MPMMMIGPVDELVKALVAAQKAIQPVVKNKHVEVRQRDGGNYSFSYADLGAIIEAIRGPLTNNDLWFVQSMERRDGYEFPVLVTRLYHTSGQFIETVNMLIVSQTTNQGFGSSLTFMKRYALSTLLGIASEDDDDANLADGNQVTAIDKNAPKVSPAERPPISPRRTPAAPKPDVLAQALDNQPPRLANPQGIEVPIKPDGSGSDWVSWGRTLMSYIKECQTVAEIKAWEMANDKALLTLQSDNPKTHSNLTTAIGNRKKDIENDSGKTAIPD